MIRYILTLCMLVTCIFLQAQSKHELNEIVIERSACFGKCPVFQIRLFQNGDVYYKGKKNVSKIGVYQSKLSRTKTRNFFKTLDALQWTSYQENYKNPARDLPHLKIQLFGRVFYKSISQAEAGPKELESIAIQLENLIKGLKWTKLRFEIPPSSIPETEEIESLQGMMQSVDENVGMVDMSNKTIQPETFSYVEQMPEFPGGYDALMTYLRKNLKYPELARELNVSGKVICQFIVFSDGSIGEVKVLRGIHPSCDSEAVRVIKSMPFWKSGKQNGVPVNVRMNLPINFVLR